MSGFNLQLKILSFLAWAEKVWKVKEDQVGGERLVDKCRPFLLLAHFMFVCTNDRTYSQPLSKKMGSCDSIYKTHYDRYLQLWVPRSFALQEKYISRYERIVFIVL